MSLLAGFLVFAAIVSVRCVRCVGHPFRQPRLSALVPKAGASSGCSDDRSGPGREVLSCVTRAPGRAAAVAGGRVRKVARRPPDDLLDLRLGGALVAAFAVAAVAGVVAGALAGAACWGVPAARGRGRRRQRAAVVLDEAPEVVDLFRLATSAGLNLHLAVAVVARHADGVIADACADVAHRVARGDRLSEALGCLAPLGEPARPLLDALLACDRYGIPIAPALDRVADAGRELRRRRHEEAARAVPVKLLFPLVFCTLPALGLLTVVPVLARSWPALMP